MERRILGDKPGATKRQGKHTGIRIKSDPIASISTFFAETIMNLPGYNRITAY